MCAELAAFSAPDIKQTISFASIEGLGEPPASAVPTDNGDAGSMTDENRDSQRKGLFGRLFGR